MGQAGYVGAGGPARSDAIRPGAVGFAVKLLYIVLAAGVVTSLLTLWMAVDQDQTPREASAVNLLGILVGYGIFWFLIDRIGRGRNWARMLYLVMTVIGSPFLVMSFRQEMEIIPVQAWISVGLMGLQIVAVIALFQQESSNWYRQMKLNI
jgi:hypothetical protein